jgi:hypothetical protein
VRVVPAVDFVSDDPTHAGTMTMTWEVTAVDAGTRIDIRADAVPAGSAKITLPDSPLHSPTSPPTSSSNGGGGASIHSKAARGMSGLPPYQFSGGLAVVIGAASGIGEQLANQLAVRRSNLHLIDRDEVQLAAVADCLARDNPAVTGRADIGQRDASWCTRRP